MKKPKKGYQSGGPIQEEPKKKPVNDQFYGVSSFRWKPSDISSAGYKLVAPGIYSNPMYDPKVVASAPQYVSYKQLPPGHPMLSKDQKEAYGFYGVEDPFKPKASTVPIKTPQVQAPVVQTPISTSPVSPPQKERMVLNSFGQMGAGTYAQYDAQGNPVWYNKQGPLPVLSKKNGGIIKGYEDGGWIDAQGNLVNDPNINHYSPEEIAALGYKKAPTGQLGSMQRGAGVLEQNNLYGTAGNIAGSGIQAYLDKKHGGGPSVAGSTVGGAFRGAGAGAQMGAKIGNMIAPGVGGAVGASFGALTGATIGGGLGLIKGKKGVQEHKQMGELDATQQALANQYNPAGNGSYTSSMYNPKDYKSTFGIQGFFANGGMVKGGKIEGPGGPKDDAIKAKVEADSFVVPAENSKVAEYLRSQYLTKGNQKANLKQKNGEGVFLSNGEHLFTPKETEELLKNGIDVNMLAPNSDDNMYAPQNWHFKKGGLTPEKAREILHDKSVHGHPLTDKQRRYFGAMASGHARKAEGGTVKMDKNEFVEEHKELVDVLRRGTKKQRLEEAKEQAEEIKGYAGGGKIGEDPYEAYRKTGKKEDPYEKYVYGSRKRVQLPPVNDTFKGIGPQAPASKLGQSKSQTTPKGVLDILKFDPSRALATSGEYEMAPEEKKTIEPATPYSPAVVSQTSGPDSAKQSPPIGSRQMDFGGIMGGLQSALGAGFLLGQGKRPTYSVGPNMQGQVRRAIDQSRYGYTPEQKSLLQNQAVESRNTALKNVYSLSGGNAGVALNNARAVFNDAYANRLKTQSDDESLRLQKMGMANSMAAQEESYRRQAFDDKLAAFMQNQQAGAMLLGTGIDNVIGAQRYAQARQANDEVNRMMYGA